jgi:hypothetical protein
MGVEMQFKARVLAVGMALLLSHAVAQGNVVSPTDSNAMSAAVTKLAEFEKGLGEVERSHILSTRLSNAEALSTWFCMENVGQIARGLALYGNAGQFVLRFASYVIDPADEQLALRYAKVILPDIFDLIATAQKDTNKIFGDDCGRRPVVYDHARKLRAIVDELKPFVSELLRRVKSGCQGCN